ncbi:MAG TPA: hypothetical protein VFO45_02165 [Sphingomicrobium sp.]|nr:hypothetical protein [Sphingomicrobium sp.]
MGESTGPDPAELANQATIFIRKAASVLEKEVAAGIVAAQSLEKRLVDVDGIRSRSPDELMQRFRRDAHDLVDVVIDLVALGVRSAETIAERAVEVAKEDGGPEKGRPRQKREQPLKPKRP